MADQVAFKSDAMYELLMNNLPSAMVPHVKSNLNNPNIVKQINGVIDEHYNKNYNNNFTNVQRGLLMWGVIFALQWGKSLRVAPNLKLVSANCLCTQVQLPDINENYFIKFVPKIQSTRLEVDDIINDSIIGQIISCTQNSDDSQNKCIVFGKFKNHAMEFVGSFLTLVTSTTNGNVWSISDMLDIENRNCPCNIGFNPDTSQIEYYACVFKVVKGLPIETMFTSTSPKIVIHQTHVLEAIPQFISVICTDWPKYGFTHNDLHLNNVFYVSNPLKLVAIDLGRCSFAKNDGSFDTIVELERTRNGRDSPSTYEELPLPTDHVSDAQYFSMLPIFDLITFCLNVERCRKTVATGFCPHTVFDSLITFAPEATTRSVFNNTKPIYEIVMNKPRHPSSENNENKFDEGADVAALIAAFENIQNTNKRYPWNVALSEGMLYAALYMVFCAKLNDSIEIFRTYPFSGVPMCMVFSNNQANMNAKDRIKFFGWLQTATRNIKQFLTFAPLRGVAPSVGGAQRMHSRRKRTMKGGAVDDDITDGLNFADVYVVAHAAQNELVNTLPPCERLPGPVVEARGGTQRKTRVRHHGRSFVVRDGPRGGRYIMVAGKKIYQM